MNLKYMHTHIPWLDEVSIGHALISDDAQSTAAASQQVTATTQELAAHMNEVENDISGLTAEIGRASCRERV